MSTWGSNKEVERRVEQALADYDGGEHNVALLSRRWHVPQMRIHRRLRGTPSQLGNKNSKKLLSEPQEIALI
ncbi:hypothetical protein K491DRAFT_299183 [Lophiostoma macrostomum CBS 122681]|uniref:HTH psq-type domain-containing protein n=1 Tax=Lophiostoma macrostomum CBS 122681 TaxID=1314788 RepID=A0A6A6SLN6_9PLEO|nr:hypothetical protein K491DRAFT_299183 [Lophiostoma macrostomum CBS 122681]